EYQNKKTEQQNNDIIASIQYAKLIQEALIPSDNLLQQHFPDHFILYKPKDIISGDFYWTKRIQNNGFDITLLAAVDCTGHGVPGAMMSMLGIAFLNEIVLKKEVYKASHVLDKLREKIIESLQTSSNGKITHDGMDIALTMIDHKTDELHFTGANRPLYFIRNQELKIFQGNKMPIGKHGISNEHFSNIEIKLQKNDCFYIFTDGYVDQFGGVRNKKLKRQKFRNLLLENHAKSMLEQKKILDSTHIKWMGNNKQTDDILVMGIRY
ncbi:MAG: SpoIIE family protein phosphatase, partial [Bacteroidales bacterium]